MHILLVNVLDLISTVSDVEMDEVSYDEIEHIDGDFASVWTPYKFFENGKVRIIVLSIAGTADVYSSIIRERITSVCGRVLTRVGSLRQCRTSQDRPRVSQICR